MTEVRYNGILVASSAMVNRMVGTTVTIPAGQTSVVVSTPSGSTFGLQFQTTVTPLDQYGASYFITNVLTGSFVLNIPFSQGADANFTIGLMY